MTKSLLGGLLLLGVIVTSVNAGTIGGSGGVTLKDEDASLGAITALDIIGPNANCVRVGSEGNCTIDVAVPPSAVYYLGGHTGYGESRNIADEYVGTGFEAAKVVWGTSDWMLLPQGGALSVDGTNDLVTVTDHADLRPANDAGWSIRVFPTGEANGTAYCKDGNGQYCFLFAVGSGGTVDGRMSWCFVGNAAGVVLCAVTEIPMFAWSVLTVTVDETAGASNDVFRLYVNGALDTVAATQTWAMSATADALFVGGNTDTTSGGTVQYFKGRIKDVRLYNTLLSASDVATIYTGGAQCTGGETGIMLCLQADETSGTTAADSAGTAQNGTLSGIASPPTNISGWAFCPADGNCLHLDGTNDFIEIRDSSDFDFTTGDTLTLETSFMATSLAVTTTIASKGTRATGNTNFTIDVVGGTDEIRFALGNAACTAIGDTYTTTNFNAVAGTSYGIAVVHTFGNGTSGGATEIYRVDSGTATLVTGAWGTDAHEVPCNNSEPLAWGASDRNGVAPWNGRLDNLQIWRADHGTVGEVQTDMNSACTPTGTGKEGCWAANDTGGSLVAQSAALAGVGSDANNCTTAATPCLTHVGVAAKIPTSFRGSAMVVVAPGVYPEQLDLRGYGPSGQYTVAWRAQFGQPNRFYATGVSEVSSQNRSTGPGTLSTTGTAATTSSAHGLVVGDYIQVTSGSQNLEQRRVMAVPTTTTATIESVFTANQSAVTWDKLLSDLARVVGTSSGANTNNHPQDTLSLFKDATLSPFTALHQEGWLEITGPYGTGLDGYCLQTGHNYRNWFPIDSLISSSQLSIPTHWQDCGTPTASSTYKIYLHNDGVIVHGGKLRQYGIRLQDSEGIAFYRYGVTGSLYDNVLIDNSAPDELSVLKSWDAEYVAFQTDGHSKVARVQKAQFHDSYAGVNNWSSVIDELRDVSANRNLNGGIGSYFNASVRILGPLLARDNGLAGIDFENKSDSYSLNFARIGCLAAGASAGIVVAANSNLNATAPFVITSGGVCALGLSVYSHSEFGSNMQVGVRADNVITASFIGLNLERLSDCISCEDFTYSGNTTNVRVDSTSAVFEYPTGFDIVSRYRAQDDDDFMTGGITSGLIGKLQWTVTAITGTAGTHTVTGEAGRPGIFTFVTSATNPSTIQLCLATCTGLTIDPDDNFSVRFVVRVNSDVADFVRVGLAGSAASPPPLGIYFEVTSGGNWFTVTRDAATACPSGADRTCTDTAIDEVAGTWYNLLIRRVGTAVYFYNNNVQAAVHTDTSTIPTTSLVPMIQIGTTSAASKTVGIDLYEGAVIGLAR